MVKRFVCIAWFHTHQNSSLFLIISSGLAPYYTHTPKENPFKNVFDSVSRNSQQTGTVSRNSQQDGALTRLTLQRHKTKGNKDTIQIFNEFDSLHEMGVKAVF